MAFFARERQLLLARMAACRGSQGDGNGRGG
jgi:hypothetical protein